MSSGVGRGRGWLNLGAQNAKKVPGIEEPPSSPQVNCSDNKQYSDNSEDFSDLVNVIRQLNENDDGIKFNQKIKYINEIWNQSCRDGTEVEKSFDAIMNTCLMESEYATKFLRFISSQSLFKQEFHGKRIRYMFVTSLQNNYENRKQLQSTNPNGLRNSIQMMGDFFNKARLASGQMHFFMVMPILTYLEMLLESNQVEDLTLFTKQLYLNGISLKLADPEKVAELLVTIRRTLCSDNKLSEKAKLWLLLALELTNNRFALLPTDTNNFYQDQLGCQSMAYFQGSHGILTVETQENKTLDGYQSNVNVLQVSVDHMNESLQNNISNVSSLSIHSDSSQNSNVIKKDNQINKGGKTGRPILGVGARLNKNRHPDSSSNDSWHRGRTSEEAANCSSSQSESEKTGVGNWYKNKPQNDPNADNNWREKENRKGQTNAGNGDKDKRKPIPKSSNKGWEHDDRFETDYS